MLKFLQHFLNIYNNMKIVTSHDENGMYINPVFNKMSDDELLIPADKARILHSKSAEEVKLKNRKNIFRMIHSEIQKGNTSLRLEMYLVKPGILEYLSELGYTIETITPRLGGQQAFVPMTDNNEEVESDGVYRYYKVSWGAPEASNAEVPAVAMMNPN